LLAALDACGEATSKQLHEETAIPDATVRERLNELLAQEKVARLGEGKKGDPYRWTVSFRADESLKGAERNSEALEAAPTLLPEGFEAA
jgi:predicted HTH transcriptional regulator